MTVYKSYLSSTDNTNGCLMLKKNRIFISRPVSLILFVFFFNRITLSLLSRLDAYICKLHSDYPGFVCEFKESDILSKCVLRDSAQHIGIDVAYCRYRGTV